MTPPLRYDWSRVIFLHEGDTPWTAESAEAFVRRVEEIADEEAEKAAKSSEGEARGTSAHSLQSLATPPDAGWST